MDHTKYAQCIPKQIKRPYIKYIGCLNIEDTKRFIGTCYDHTFKDDDSLLLTNKTAKLIVNGRYIDNFVCPINSIIIKNEENNFSIIANLAEFYDKYDIVK